MGEKIKLDGTNVRCNFCNSEIEYDKEKNMAIVCCPELAKYISENIANAQKKIK